MTINDMGVSAEVATPQDSTLEMVSASVFNEQKQQNESLQQELRLIKDHLSLLQANQSRAPEKKVDEFEGMADDDIMTVGQFKNVAQKYNTQLRMSVEELKISQKYADYQEVVTKYLPEVLKQNPSLYNSLQQTQDFELAYYLAKNSESYKTQHKTTKRNADAEKIVKNASQSGTLSSVGGVSGLQATKKYKDMTDAEFKSEIAKNLGYV
jgi:dsDNA-binding SOS-regulon protein